MAPGTLVRGRAAAAAALCAAVALSACQGGLAATDAPQRSARAEPPGHAEAAPAERSRPGRDGADADGGTLPAQDRQARSRTRARADGGEGEGEGEDAGDEAELDLAGVDAGGEARAVVDGRPAAGSDHEFSQGLPEPPQQSIVPPPPAWAPPPSADQGQAPLIADVWPDKGPASGGERVIIRGSNLEASQVLFGLAPARIVSVSESRDALTVTAPPAQPGPVAIVVTNRDGSYALAEHAFQYYR